MFLLVKAKLKEMQAFLFMWVSKANLPLTVTFLFCGYDVVE